MKAIEMVIGVIGTLSFLFMMKTTVDTALAAIKAPEKLNFYFLFFWTLAAALLGGLLWAGCQQLLPSITAYSACLELTESVPRLTLGGSREPHGLAALLWPIVTNLPIAILLVLIAWRYALIPVHDAAIFSLVLLASLSVASLIFYDLPIFGFRGFRCYFDAKGYSYKELEMIMVLIWSFLFATISFGALYGSSKFGLFPALSLSIKDCSVAIVLLVGVTIFSVGFFIAGYPHPVFESGRGVVAAVALRISLFFGAITMFRAYTEL